MNHTTYIVLFICGILSLIGTGLMIWFLTFVFKRKKEIKTKDFGADTPNKNFIMTFWTNIGLLIIPFTLFVLGVILVGICIQPLFL